MDVIMENFTIHNCTIQHTNFYAEQSKFVAYYLITPIYFTAGILGHGFLLTSFYHQAKRESVYAYQLLLTISGLFEILAFTIYVIACKWWSNTNGGPGVDWYTIDYRFMRFSAHAARPLANALISCTLFLSVSVSADRLYALWRPVSYQRKRKFIIPALVVVCTILAFSTSVFDSFRYQLVPYDGRYVIIVNTVYIRSKKAIALAHIQNAFRLIAIISMIALNIFVIKLYKSRCTGKDWSKSRHSKIRLENGERSLIVLTVFQSIVISCAILPLMANTFVVYMDLEFSMCEWIFGYIADGIFQTASIVNFYTTLVISRSLRRSILLMFIPSGEKCNAIAHLKTVAKRWC